MFYSRKSLLVFYYFLILLSLTTSTISPRNKNKVKQQKGLRTRKGPLEENVFDRGLVESEPSARDILIENAAYYKNTSLRNFNGTVLGYVTPWNNHGYDVAKIWAKKFDFISPVWLQINRLGENSYKLSGAHDIDINWMKDIRKAGKIDKKTLKVYPRIMFDKFNENDFSKLLTFHSESDAVNEIILKACRDYKFDGIVLEVWQQLSARVNDDVLFRLVTEMSDTLKTGGFKLILVVPPLREEMHDLFSAKHFEYLYPHVHAFSLMTYDFSSVQRPGANAPLHWMKTTVENIIPSSADHYKLKRKKLLMGLNMYGNDYTPDGGSPIIGNQFLDLLKNLKKRLTFDEHDVENFFEIKTSNGRHMVFYPTLFSIHERIKLAEELGVGLSLWELGQGLDYFYDMF